MSHGGIGSKPFSSPSGAPEGETVLAQLPHFTRERRDWEGKCTLVGEQTGPGVVPQGQAVYSLLRGDGEHAKPGDPALKDTIKLPTGAFSVPARDMSSPGATCSPRRDQTHSLGSQDLCDYRWGSVTHPGRARALCRERPSAAVT